MPEATRKPKLTRAEKGSRKDPIWDPFGTKPGALAEGKVNLSCPLCRKKVESRAALVAHAESKHGGNSAEAALERKLSAAIREQTTREASVEELVRLRMKQARANVAYSRALGTGPAGETRPIDHSPVPLSGRLGKAWKKKRA